MIFSQEIITVLDYLCQKFGIVIDWTSDSIMPYLEDLSVRYIRYEIMSSIAWMLVFPMIAIIVAIPLSILHKKAKELRWDEYRFVTVAAIALWVAFIIMILTSIIIITVNAFHIIECYTIPERVILDYLTGLMESGR